MPKKCSRVDPCQTQTVVELELEGFTPSDSDRGGIIRLLSHIFTEDAAVSTGQIADLIISNHQVGSVVKQVDDVDVDDEDDGEEDSVVFALISAIDISMDSATNDGVKTVRHFLFDLLNNVDMCEEKSRIIDLLMNPTVKICFLINERLETLPLSVCANAVEILPSELKTANMYPSHLVMVFRAYKSDATGHDLDYYYEEYRHIQAFSLHTLTVYVRPDDFDTAPNKIYTILIIMMEKFKDVLNALQSLV
ncbi:hypothetical protein D915_000780 [Fasciola hepatica]|uniref:Protein BCCIP homolog n=1 Tax=Fasciola hepatica TaxID=6192 RepID=A0A2H1CV70_FASHE|nr:hypothetical protein D915_000780 [Fasciola hepatica]